MAALDRTRLRLLGMYLEALLDAVGQVQAGAGCNANARMGWSLP
jgi:hypothetical protein